MNPCHGRTCSSTRIAHILRTNNTPQAYPSVHCRDAQTGGLLFSADAMTKHKFEVMP